MKTALEKLKAIVVLISMVIVSLAIVWTVNQFSKESSNYHVYSNQQYVNQDVTEWVVIDTSIPQNGNNIEYIYTQQALDSSVLGVSTSCNNAVDIESESICYRTKEEEVDLKDGDREGVMVRKDANITLEYVRVPLELFSGMEVADSNRKITTQTPTFKAAGEQFDDLSSNVLLPPRQQIYTYKSETELEDKTFTTSYSVGSGTDTNAEISSDGRIGVYTKLENECDDPEYNNKSNVTPSRSNGRAELQYDQVRYPNEKKLEIDEEEIVEMCKEEDKFIEWVTEFEGCRTGVIQKAISFIKNIFDLEWEECQENDTGCMDVADIVLIMASPFGSNEGCGDDGTCTNAYMNRRNNIVQAPAAGSSGKTYYTTDCEVRIGRGGNIFLDQTFTVKCAWDMSHLYKELEVNKFDDIPNIETTPTPEEYNDFLQNDVRGRRLDAIPLPN